MSLLNNIFGSGAQQALIGAEEDMYNMRAQQYTTALGQSMVATGQHAAANAYNAMAQNRASTQPIKPFNPNELEAFKIPLSQLVTLWQAKYGDEWVEKPDEAFWMDALTRLNVAGKFEHAGGWYRIKEDA